MRAANIGHLGIKELRSLAHDRAMLVLIGYAFSVAVYIASTALPGTLNNAPIAVVDEDHSMLSHRITDVFQPPYFRPAQPIERTQMDRRLDNGVDTFALDIPPHFERDALAGRSPAIQLNVDATRISQALAGTGYIETMVQDEATRFLRRDTHPRPPPVDLVLRTRFNPSLNPVWFGAVMQLIDNVTILSVVLTGAALIREREHGTLEHLLVMPVTPLEIMLSKVWATALVVLAAATFSMVFIVRGLLAVPVEGSITLFVFAAALHLFATTSMGIYLGTLARSMPQLGMLFLLLLLPLKMLSGEMTPLEAMPAVIQYIMMLAPTTHFVMLAQSVLYRGAGLSQVWPQLLAIAAIGTALFSLSARRFRKSISRMV